MKAMRAAQFGGPELLRYEDAPEPQLKDGHVLIQVKATGINFRQVPKAQRVRVLTMAQWLACSDSPAHALWRGHIEGGLTMTAMAADMGKSVAWVSKMISAFEKAQLA